MNDQLILDRYRLIERLAVGGSAEVWRAQDLQLDRPVAVKRLHPHLLPDESSRLRLAAEARAAASLSHPVIVGVYDVDATGEAPALVMELVDGESLSARIERDGPMPERQAAAVAADVAEALYHAHQRGVIHRDVKPGNVLLGADGRTRLVDFGIAHSLADASERLTMTGTVIGTLPAMAPEQLAGGAITPRTDLYGLGVVMHEAVTGRPPYPPMPPVALAELQRSGAPPLTGIDPALAAVIAACLAHDSADRPLHAGALAAALRDWLAGDPSAALAMSPRMGISADTSALTRPIAVVSSPDATAGQRSPRTLRAGLIVGLAVLGALALAGFVLTGLGQPNGALVPPTDSPSSAVSVAPVATAPPSEAPAWLAGLVRKVEKQCGSDAAAAASADLASMSHDAAKDRADELARACKEDDSGKGNDD